MLAEEWTAAPASRPHHRQRQPPWLDIPAWCLAGAGRTVWWYATWFTSVGNGLPSRARAFVLRSSWFS